MRLPGHADTFPEKTLELWLSSRVRRRSSLTLAVAASFNLFCLSPCYLCPMKLSYMNACVVRTRVVAFFSGVGFKVPDLGHRLQHTWFLQSMEHAR